MGEHHSWLCLVLVALLLFGQKWLFELGVALGKAIEDLKNRH